MGSNRKNALFGQAVVGGLAALCLAILGMNARTFGQQAGTPGQPAAAAQAAPARGASANGQQNGRPGPGRPVAGFQFHEPSALNFDDHTGYVSIFDGQTLNGWDGDPSVWKVENGAIVGVSTPEHPSHSFIVYKNLTAKDLDLKFEIKVEQGGGSGMQYRSTTGAWPRPANAPPNPNNPTPANGDWLMTGPQADFWFPVRPDVEQYTGQFYTENHPFRIIAWRGEVVEMGPGESPQLVGEVQDRRALGGYVKTNDWNQYEVIARNGTFIHIINGQLMAVLVDDDATDVNNKPGLIGIEIEGAPSKVSVRNIYVKKFN